MRNAEWGMGQSCSAEHHSAGLCITGWTYSPYRHLIQLSNAGWKHAAGLYHNSVAIRFGLGLDKVENGLAKAAGRTGGGGMAAWQRGSVAARGLTDFGGLSKEREASLTLYLQQRTTPQIHRRRVGPIE